MRGGHDVSVVTESELLAEVETRFSFTGRGLRQWPDPHPDRPPRDEEYSRLLDPAKWRILGARAQAWSDALVGTGLGTVELDTSVAWLEVPRVVTSRVDRVVPRAADALDLVVVRTHIGDVEGAGVTLGAGDPPTCVDVFPVCGCDACDDGSQAELENLDRHFLGIVTGAFLRLSNGPRTITVIAPSGWSASGLAAHKVEAVLADPTGWVVLTGASWLTAT